MNESAIITRQEFENVALRSGSITGVEDFPKARKPACKVTVDFGSDPEVQNGESAGAPRD